MYLDDPREVLLNNIQCSVDTELSPPTEPCAIQSDIVSIQPCGCLILVGRFRIIATMQVMPLWRKMKCMCPTLRFHCLLIENNSRYVPKTRSDLNIPKEEAGRTVRYEEYFNDTPLYTLFMLVCQQLLAFPAYLLFNVSGQKTYPTWYGFLRTAHSLALNISEVSGLIILLVSVREK